MGLIQLLAGFSLYAGVGLFFLEACQSARSDERPEASVAGRLLQSGIASVAAMESIARKCLERSCFLKAFSWHSAQA